MLLLNLALSLTLPFSFLKMCEAKLSLTYRFSDPRSRSQTEKGQAKDRNVTKIIHLLPQKAFQLTETKGKLRKPKIIMMRPY